MTLKEILDPRTMFELCKTIEGKAQVKQAALVARITLGTHEAFRYMQDELRVFTRNLSYEEQQNVCNILMWAMLSAKHEEVIAFIRDIPIESIEDHETIIGSC